MEVVIVTLKENKNFGVEVEKNCSGMGIEAPSGCSWFLQLSKRGRPGKISKGCWSYKTRYRCSTWIFPGKNRKAEEVPPSVEGRRFREFAKIVRAVGFLAVDEEL